MTMLYRRNVQIWNSGLSDDYAAASMFSFLCDRAHCPFRHPGFPNMMHIGQQTSRVVENVSTLDRKSYCILPNLWSLSSLLARDHMWGFKRCINLKKNLMLSDECKIMRNVAICYTFFTNRFAFHFGVFPISSWHLSRNTDKTLTSSSKY